jgi:acetoin utilization deacetylase AcuC-like enzyme
LYINNKNEFLTHKTICVIKYSCIFRPPGHHAMKAEYCGYCFFNNVAIAAEIALRNNLCKRILIVDWDVHHGQATQRMFYNDPRYLLKFKIKYFSKYNIYALFNLQSCIFFYSSL